MTLIARPLSAAFLAACIGACLTVSVFAQAQPRGGGAVLASADGAVRVNALSNVTAPPGTDRGVQSCIDMSGINGWDGLDDPDNVIIDIDISSSLKVTGVAWDVGIASVGNSWLADAAVLISNSDGIGDPNAIILTPGFAVGAPGDQEFSSGGIVTFADQSPALPDVEPNADGLVRLQIHETFDDFPDAIDSAWRNAAAPVTCPGIWLELDDIPRPGGPGIPPETDPNSVPLDHPAALVLLMLLLAVAGMRFLTRRT